MIWHNTNIKHYISKLITLWCVIWKCMFLTIVSWTIVPLEVDVSPPQNIKRWTLRQRRLELLLLKQEASGMMMMMISIGRWSDCRNRNKNRQKIHCETFLHFFPHTIHYKTFPLNGYSTQKRMIGTLWPVMISSIQYSSLKIYALHSPITLIGPVDSAAGSSGWSFLTWLSQMVLPATGTFGRRNTEVNTVEQVYTVDSV